MSNIKELYRKNVYGVMGTLIFHILLIAGFWVVELRQNVKIEKEESVLLDFTLQKEKKDISVPDIEKQITKNMVSDQSIRNQQSGSNRAVNDAAKSTDYKDDQFFDDNYKHDIDEAKKMVADVNKQLSKKILQKNKLEMPEATTQGQDPDSIKNVIYSGKSNIHYFLENRYHVRMPIPVYLAKSGGIIKVDIQVDQLGRVIKAEVKPDQNSSDPTLKEYATIAAERTVFNADTKAPLAQKGSITYKFVAQ